MNAWRRATAVLIPLGVICIGWFAWRAARADTTVDGTLQLDVGTGLESWCNDVTILEGTALRIVTGNLTIGCPSALGATCTGSGDCASGYCVDGVCCDSGCSGGCGSCNQPGFVGTCRPSSAGTICRGAVAACDAPETCNGVATSCPSDALKPIGTSCRAVAGDCDLAETCTGASGVCPADAFAGAAQMCRSSAGACDLAENCTGSSASCPANSYRPVGTVCLAGTGVCDPADVCSGSSAGCPVADPTGLACDDNNGCTVDRCTSGGQCVGSTPVCPSGSTFICGDTPYCSLPSTPPESGLVCGPS